MSGPKIRDIMAVTKNKGARHDRRNENDEGTP
jgi:hypothetical protein